MRRRQISASSGANGHKVGHPELAYEPEGVTGEETGTRDFRTLRRRVYRQSKLDKASSVRSESESDRRIQIHLRMKL